MPANKGVILEAIFRRGKDIEIFASVDKAENIERTIAMRKRLTRKTIKRMLFRNLEIFS